MGLTLARMIIMRVRQPVLVCGDLRLDPATGEAWQGERRLVLPRKQLRILEYLMRHRGEVVSQEQLLEMFGIRIRTR